MKQETAADRNRTGLGSAPRKGRDSGEAGWQPIPAAPGDPVEISRVRAYYGRQAEPVGTVPSPAPQVPGAQPPSTAYRGGNAAVLIDRLGERLAQARIGARLYEMLLGKLEAESSPVVPARSETLRRFRDQEARNFRLLWECIERLGADPTVETPCADLSCVRSMGLIRLLSDPRASFAQALDAMLVAELADNEGWRLLASLAEAMGKADLADAFRAALAGEGLQLDTIRRWWSEANLSPSGTGKS